MALGGNSSGGTSAGAIKAGEAFFKITGDDQELRKLLNKNIDRIKRFGQTIRNIGIGVAGAGGLVLAPLVGLFKTSLDKAANTEKLAQRLDSTAESISRVGYAADITGVQIEDWVKAAEKMNEAALKSAKGGVDQSIAFLKMGVSAQDFVKMGLEDKLLLVADALEKAENPLEKHKY
jgi:methyl-accepting chemotaxis protein